MKVNTGSLWLGREWKEAIKLSLETPDCGVKEVYKDKYPNRLLDDEKILIGYEMYGYGNRFKRYHTRIPKKLNQYTKELLEKEKSKEKI